MTLNVDAAPEVRCRSAQVESEPQEDAPSGIPLASRFYHPELDGLRFLAFLWVFVHHAFPVSQFREAPPQVAAIMTWITAFARAGEAGVDLFFLLSAYLITELLVREHARQGFVDIRSFYVRRALRIWPLYYGFLLFAVFAEARWLGNAGLSGRYAVPFAVFLGNWSIALCSTLPASSALILWSVSIEEQFYIVWPWLVSWCTPRRLVKLAVVLLLVANLTRLYLVLREATEYGVYFNTFARMDGIACGCLLSALLGGAAPRLSRATRAVLFAVGIAVIVVAVRYLHLEPISQNGQLALYPLWTLGAAIIFLATLQTQGETRGWLSRPAAVYLGRISYGLYVFHLLAVILAFKLLPALTPCLGGVGAVAIAAAIALLLTTLLATLSFYALERPFLHLKLRFTHVPSRPGG